jgi:hypothetical protein
MRSPPDAGGARRSENPALHEVLGEDLDVTWAKQEAYERGQGAACRMTRSAS